MPTPTPPSNPPRSIQEQLAQMTPTEGPRRPAPNHPQPRKGRLFKKGMLAAALALAAYCGREQIGDAAEYVEGRIHKAWHRAFDSQPVDLSTRSAAETQAAKQAAQDLAATYDNLLFIKHDPVTGQNTRAPIYDEMQNLARASGREREFNRFYESMERLWIGTPGGSGGMVYDEHMNPQGKLATLNETLVAPAVQGIYERMYEFSLSLHGAPGFTQQAKQFPGYDTLLQAQSAHHQLYLTSKNEKHGNLGGAYATLQSTPQYRGLSQILPRNAATPATGMVVTQMVADEINALDQQANKTTTGVNAAVWRGLTDHRSLCSAAVAYYNFNMELRASDFYDAAIRNVQQRESQKPDGLNIGKTMDSLRDGSAMAARNAQRAFGYSCGAPS